MNKLYKKFILITAVILMLSLFGCSRQNIPDTNAYKSVEPGTMLVDYYEQTVGTPMKMPYYELVMYAYSDVQIKLERYINGGMEDERREVYLLPLRAAEEVFDVIRKTDMPRWNDSTGTSLNGMFYVCKFLNENGDHFRVSSENMPENGSKSFSEVKEAMSKYIKPEYIIETE